MKINCSFYRPFAFHGLIIFLFVTTGASYAQVAGCRDPLAINYNPLATITDGSCIYNATTYSPVTKIDPISNVLNETSGLQMAGGFLWSLNDGGGAAAIYKLDTSNGSILQTVNLAGATNVHWEDIAFDGSSIYIGDFGNNANGARTNLKIYKFPLNLVPDHIANPIVTIASADIGVIHFSYSDQPRPITPASTNHTKFDCEAMIVDGGAIHLFTKNWVDLNTTHYVISGVDTGTYVATPIETLSTNYLVTSADKAVGENVVVLLGYQNTGTGKHFIHVLSDYGTGKYFNGNTRRIDLPDVTVMGQSEGITFRNSTYGYISNEKFTRSIGPVTLTVNQKLHSFNTVNFIPPYVLPVTIKQFTVTQAGKMHKISWIFNETVDNLQLQYSSDAIHFVALKKYTSSKGDQLLNKPLSRLNYYRLSWGKINEPVHYSDIVSLRSEENAGIGKFLLKANGELSFIVSSANGVYAFKLLGADGKSLAQVKESVYNFGLNRIQLNRTYPVNNVVYLNIYSKSKTSTAALYVQK